MAKRKQDSAPSTGSSDDRYKQLRTLGRKSYVTREGIAKLLKQIEEDGMPEHYSRSSQYRARKDFCNTLTNYGAMVEYETVPTSDGGETTIAYQNPHAFMHHNAKHSPHLARIILDAYERYPCTPTQLWSIIVYQDGVDPSDGLAKKP